MYLSTYLSIYFAYKNHVLTMLENSTPQPIILAIRIYLTNCNEQRYITQWGVGKAPQSFESLYQERDSHLSQSTDEDSHISIYSYDKTRLPLECC
jgi:hypothetical protein